MRRGRKGSKSKEGRESRGRGPWGRRGGAPGPGGAGRALVSGGGARAEFGEKNRGLGGGSFAETANLGEVVVLAVKGRVALEALGGAGAGNLAGKIVIDAVNPIADAPISNGVLRFFTEMNQSLM